MFLTFVLQTLNEGEKTISSLFGQLSNLFFDFSKIIADLATVSVKKIPSNIWSAILACIVTILCFWYSGNITAYVMGTYNEWKAKKVGDKWFTVNYVKTNQLKVNELIAEGRLLPEHERAMFADQHAQKSSDAVVLYHLIEDDPKFVSYFLDYNAETLRFFHCDKIADKVAEEKSKPGRVVQPDFSRISMSPPSTPMHGRATRFVAMTPSRSG